MRGQDRVVEEHVHLGPRRQRGQRLQALGGLEQQMRRAFAPRLPQLDQHAPIGAASQPLLGQRWAKQVPALCGAL
jgi:hypothetical protein